MFGTFTSGMLHTSMRHLIWWWIQDTISSQPIDDVIQGVIEERLIPGNCSRPYEMGTGLLMPVVIGMLITAQFEVTYMMPMVLGTLRCWCFGDHSVHHFVDDITLVFRVQRSIHTGGLDGGDRPLDTWSRWVSVTCTSVI